MSDLERRIVRLEKNLKKWQGIGVVTVGIMIAVFAYFVFLNPPVDFLLDLHIKNLKAEHILVYDPYDTNGFIDLSVDANGPLITASFPNGYQSNIGAVPVNQDFGTARTKFPAFSICSLSKENVWIAPYGTQPVPIKGLRKEVLVGTDEERVKKFVDQMLNMKIKKSEKD